MKSMMSQVKKISKITLCALLFLAAGCKDQNRPSSLYGNTEQPSWTASENYDMTTSMTAVVKVDLSSTYTEEQLTAAGFQVDEKDILAAFSGESCLGAAVPQDGLFYLYICAPADGGDVTLRYYSSVLKNIFIAAPFSFSNDMQLGSVAMPYTPRWATED